MVRDYKKRTALCSPMVGVRRLELPASWSRTMRATNCATPREGIPEIGTRKIEVRFGGEGGIRTLATL